MIYIIGGQGFVGAGIVRSCMKYGLEHKVVTRQNYTELKGSSCDILINCSTNSKKYLAEDSPRADFEQTVMAVHESIFDFKYRKYVLISSAEVYGSSVDMINTSETTHIEIPLLTNYGFSKRLAELLVEKYCHDWLIFRMGGFVGPGLKKNPIFDLLNGQKLRVSRDSLFQFIDTDTSGQITIDLSLSEQQNEIFNLTARGQVSLIEAAEIAERSLDIIPNAPILNHSLDITKISRFCSIPTSRDSVVNYIRSFVDGDAQKV